MSELTVGLPARLRTDDSSYAAWLERRGLRLYQVGGVPWAKYRVAPMPVSIGLLFITPPLEEVEAALRASGAWLARFCSDPVEHESAWWYVACDTYDPARLSSAVRSKINRGNRRCTVRRVETAWLAEHGYACYLAAYARYINATPADPALFRSNLLATIGGPEEHWAVFRGDELAGFCQCIVDGKDVTTNVLKYDPAHLKDYTSYALISELLRHYVGERGLVLNNGTRSLAHETNVQTFLLQLGFRQRFCRLNVVYRPPLGAAVRVLFPTRKMLGGLPARGHVADLRSLLLLESVRRSCLGLTASA